MCQLKNFFFRKWWEIHFLIFYIHLKQKKIFFANTPPLDGFLCVNLKIFFFENGGKFIFSSSIFIWSKKKFFLSILPLDGFSCANLKNFFFSKMVGNPFSHILDSFEAKKNFFYQYPPPWDFFGKNLILLLARKKKKNFKKTLSRILARHNKFIFPYVSYSECFSIFHIIRLEKKKKKKKKKKIPTWKFSLHIVNTRSLRSLAINLYILSKLEFYFIL